jgi:four helix bundle protein
VQIWLKLGGSVGIRQLFISELSDAESEAAETQVWIEFAMKCGYLERDQSVQLYKSYDEILRMLVAMINKPQSWVISR